MPIRLALIALLAASLGWAQADAVGNLPVLAELRSIRGVLERMERGQRALLLLVRLQTDQARLTMLETQWSGLSEREAEWSREAAAERRNASAPAAQLRTADGGVEPAPKADDGAQRSRLAESELALREARERKRMVGEEMARLKARVEAAGKMVEELLSQ
jgi:hypothetical protein